MKKLVFTGIVTLLMSSFASAETIRTSGVFTFCITNFNQQETNCQSGPVQNVEVNVGSGGWASQPVQMFGYASVAGVDVIKEDSTNRMAFIIRCASPTQELKATLDRNLPYGEAYTVTKSVSSMNPVGVRCGGVDTIQNGEKVSVEAYFDIFTGPHR